VSGLDDLSKTWFGSTEYSIESSFHIGLLYVHEMCHSSPARWTQMSLMRDYGNYSSCLIARLHNADHSDRCRQMSPRPSHTPSDVPSTPITTIIGMEYTSERILELTKTAVYDQYEMLKDLGGRPSREINSNPGPCPPSKSDTDKTYHVSDHWNGESERIGGELKRWLDFRWHQFRKRRDSKTFDLYKKTINEYQSKEGIDRVFELQLDRQTKLDEWQEYHLYERQERPSLVKALEQAKRDLETKMEEMKSRKWGELKRHDNGFLQAQAEVEKAQKRLDVLTSGKLQSSIERKFMIKQAEEELMDARRILVKVSNELDQLSKEAERKNAEQVLAIYRGKLDGAKVRLEQLDSLLEWIVEQSEDVGTEDKQHNRDLLKGWEKCYAYMHRELRRMQAMQDDMPEMPKRLTQLNDDSENSQELVRPYTALLAWIEREFPELEAESCVRDNSSHWNRDDLMHLKSSPDRLTNKASRRKTSSQGLVLTDQPSKASKPFSRQNRQRKNKSSAVCCVKGAERAKEQESPKVAVRRSERLAQRFSSPSRSSFNPRRSVRLIERAKKVHPSRVPDDVKPALISKMPKEGTARICTKKTSSSKAPQGISKPRQRLEKGRKGRRDR
jgi:hypothetical protein